MKESIRFTKNYAVEVVHSTEYQRNILNKGVYPFLVLDEGTMCVVNTLYKRTKQLRMGYSSIEHFYTYHHVSLMMCGTCENNGFYMSIVGKVARVYILRDTSCIQYEKFVKIRRLSVYKNRVYVQLEQGMTLITVEAMCGDEKVEEYLLGKVRVRIERMFGHSWDFWFTQAVVRYL